jgi:CDGSH-type Zn-finger protein
MVDIPAKQCFCGRSASFPYCDGTHKIKKEKDEEKSE